VAVSKTKPLAAIAAAYAAGQRCFGENYVQELVEKANDPASPHDIQWHFIGTLQSNKAKIVAAVPNLAMIETVTSMKLAKLLEKAVAGSDRATPLAVMVQLNTSGEENKGGVEPDQCSGVVSAILKECPHLKFAGLMTIGQYGRVTAAGEVNPDFALLVKSRDEVGDPPRAPCHLALSRLSMKCVRYVTKHIRWRLLLDGLAWVGVAVCPPPSRTLSRHVCLSKFQHGPLIFERRLLI
jgi:pyridoxal phosphate enzyme (YggS family)